MTPSQPPRNPNETNWIVHVNESVRHLPPKFIEERHWNQRSIYRVPACIAKLKRKAYWPQVVSFGPYHHGKDHLHPMEEHKRRALFHFLWRSRRQVEPFLESLREVVRYLEDSYQTLHPKWKESGSGGASGRFLQLLMTDGCFMLEILRIRTDPQNDYPPNDPIFGKVGFYIMPLILRDMLMLENQLPMLLLERLVAVESGGRERYNYINKLILSSHYPRTHITEMDKCSPVDKCHRVLDVVLRNLLLQENQPNKVQPDLDDIGRMTGMHIIRSATELNEAGIQLKKSETRSLIDISFADGVLNLPAIMVDEAAESMFLNLMTFERFHFGASMGVTAYIFFMDGIIDTEQDVALLRTQGIIQSSLGSNKEVAKLFNSLTWEMMLRLEDREEPVQKKIEKQHCKERWNKWRANLIHTYFRNPWSILSLVAAILLFTLTIIQTVYRTLSYYN